MSETKHAAGPWSIVRGDSVVNVKDSNGADVAATNSKAYWQRHDDTDLANARLIAACPTMYAYIAKKAQDGDADAARILAAL